MSCCIRPEGPVDRILCQTGHIVKKVTDHAYGFAADTIKHWGTTFINSFSLFCGSVSLEADDKITGRSAYEVMKDIFPITEEEDSLNHEEEVIKGYVGRFLRTISQMKEQGLLPEEVIIEIPAYTQEEYQELLETLFHMIIQDKLDYGVQLLQKRGPHFSSLQDAIILDPVYVFLDPHQLQFILMHEIGHRVMENRFNLYSGFVSSLVVTVDCIAMRHLADFVYQVFADGFVEADLSSLAVSVSLLALAYIGQKAWSHHIEHSCDKFAISSLRSFVGANNFFETHAALTLAVYKRAGYYTTEELETLSDKEITLLVDGLTVQFRHPSLTRRMPVPDVIKGGGIRRAVLRFDS